MRVKRNKNAVEVYDKSGVAAIIYESKGIIKLPRKDKFEKVFQNFYKGVLKPFELVGVYRSFVVIRVFENEPKLIKVHYC